MMLSKLQISLIASLIAALLTLPWGFSSSRRLDDLRNLVFDDFQRLKPRVYDPDGPVRIVGIDERSLEAYGQWPWPRRRVAELVDRLREYGAAAIVFDVIFSEPDQASAGRIIEALPDRKLRAEISKVIAGFPDNDTLLASAIGKAPVVLGATMTEQGGRPFASKAGFAMAGDDPAPFLVEFPGALLPLAELNDKAMGLGVTNWLPDRDLVVRRVPLLLRAGKALAPALTLEALRVAQNEPGFVVRSSNASGESVFGASTGVNAVKVGQFEIPTGPEADVRPRYSLRNPARIISARAVFEGSVRREEIEGRIVFVGALAVGLGDVRATPLEPIVPGVELQAQIVEALTSGGLLSRPDWAKGAERFIALVAFALTMLMLFRAPMAVSAFIAPVFVVAMFSASFYLFDAHGLLLDPSYPSLVVVGAYVVGAVALLWRENIARRQVRNAFGKFVAPAIVDRLAENPERLVLGGETRDLTVLFSDLRNFSGLSEGMSARELTQFMNDYLTPMTDAILETEGTVDKYMGDAIVAFWNAPLDTVDHTHKALQAALRMRNALAAFNDQRARLARAAGQAPVEIRMGCGLNRGPCNVGNMGSARRFDYSILGDNVNLASRLEGASKLLGVDILVSSAVRDAAPDMAWLALGHIVVVGRKEPTGVHALAGEQIFAASQEFQRWRTAHDDMFAHYESGRFAEAEERARILAQAHCGLWGGLYVTLEKRYASLAQEETTQNWSPVWNLASK